MPKTEPMTARLRSASAKTIEGDLPPSSSETRLIVPAPARMTERPVTVEPVKAILFTSGCSARAAPATSPRPGTTLKMPGGERCRALAAGDVEREVPGDDHPHDAHRLLADVVEGVLRERENPAVDRPHKALEEAPRVPAGGEIDERRLADRLADVVALDPREALLLCLDDLGDAEEDAGALVRVEVAPGGKGAARRPDGAGGVLGLCRRA